MSKVSLFGKVALKREFCSACDGWYFVVDGRLQCCDAEAPPSTVRSVRRESIALAARLTNTLKRTILSLQRNACYLCGVDLTSELYFLRRGRPHRLRVEFDHFIPRSFCPNNDTENIYAMCSLCNSHKGSRMFEDRAAATAHVRARRMAEGTWDLYTSIEMSASEKR